MKDKSFYILITSILLLCVMSLMLIVFLNRADEKFEGSITATENGITETLIPVRDLVLSPGISKEYDVNLICEASGVYFVHLDLQENHDGGMKEFVNVVIEFDGEKVHEGPLTELLDDGLVVETTATLEAEEPVLITFRYSMPVTIGNEAQGTTSEFDVHVIIEKK